jgi:transposase
MARSLRIRRPTTAEIQHLQHVVEISSDWRQRRRAEILLLYGAGLTATAIAEWLGLHRNTVCTVLHAFGRRGLAASLRVRHGGAPRRLTARQITRIRRLAEQPPSQQGLPYGRWSLAKLREYVIHQRIIKQISREHLRRLLKKGAFGSNAFSANLSVRIRNAWRFWHESAGFGDCYPAAAFWCSSM